MLPEYFFRTAHHIPHEKRIEIQSICQKYIDHSISSTVNLPESINPEVISNIYLDAWRKGLKGITIYRDGSRYPILSVQKQQSEFQKLKNNFYTVEVNSETLTLYGDEVFTLPDGTLSTPFHALQDNVAGVKVTENSSTKTDFGDGSEQKKSAGACKVKFEGGKLVKDCGD